MFLAASMLNYVSFPDLSTTPAGRVDDCAGDSGVVSLGLALGLLSALGCEAEELSLEVAFFFLLLPLPFFVDCLPLHSVADLDVPVNLELRNEIGLVTSRKTPAIILPPIWVVFVK